MDEMAVADAVLSPLPALLLLAGLIGLLAGAVLVIRPGWLGQLGRRLNAWVPTRKLEQELEQAIDLDRWFYHHHRESGLLLLAGACWIVVFLAVFFNKFGAIDALVKASGQPRQLVEGMLDGMVLLGLAGSLFAALVSLFLLLRPSLLRDFEQGANQWVSTHEMQKVLEVSRTEADRYVLRHYRLFGLLLLAGGLFILGMLAFWYGRHAG